MEITFLKKFLNNRHTKRTGAFILGMMLSGYALAAGDMSGLCFIPQLMKAVTVILAACAVFMWAVMHMSKRAEMADLAMQIGVPVVIASFVVTLLAQLGMQSTCNL